MTVYLLEMLITTSERVVSEPLGVYDTMRKAKSHMQKVERLRPETESVSFNIIKFEMNDKPSILKMKEVAMQYVGEELFMMFQLSWKSIYFAQIYNYASVSDSYAKIIIRVDRV